MGIFRSLLVILVLAALGAGAVYVVSPSLFLEQAIKAERRASGLHHRQTDIPGFRLHYLDNEGTGAPLLLIHGFGGDKDNWTRVARQLTPHYRIIAPDLPGYGESDAPDDVKYGIQIQVERLREFIRALGLTQVHLGGNSMGGAIAATYAAKYPNDVSSLWLIASAGVGGAPPSEVRIRIAQGERNSLIASSREEYAALLDVVMEKPPYLPVRLRNIMADRAIKAHALREQQCADLVAEAWTLEPVISGLPVATHILWGEQDRALHVGAVNILSQILPKSSATTMPGIGHVPMLEVPVETADDYLKFRKAFDV